MATFYPYNLTITKEFLTGTLAGLTYTSSFGICHPEKYDTANMVGTVKQDSFVRSTTYRILSAIITPNDDYTWPPNE